MRIISNEPTIELGGLELDVMVKGDGYYKEPLIAIKDQLDAMLSHHSKVFVFRFDIRIKGDSYYNEEGIEFDTFTDDNQIITNYLKVFNRWLKEGTTSYVLGMFGVERLRRLKSNITTLS